MLKKSPILVILSAVFAVFAFAQDDQGWEDIRDEASAYDAEYDYEAARDAYERAIEAAVEQGADFDSRLQLQMGSAEALLELREYEQADEQLLATLAATELEVGPEDTRIANCLSLLAEAAVGRVDSKQAESYLLRALGIRRESHGDDHLDVVEDYLSLGEVYLSLEQPEEGSDAFERAVEVQDRIYELFTMRAEIRERIAGFYNDNGYRQESEYYLLKTMESLETGPSRYESEIVGALLALGLKANRWGSQSEARTILTRAIDLDRDADSPDPKVSNRLHASLAKALRASSYLPEAEAEARKALDVLTGTDLVLEREAVLVQLGGILGDQNKWDDAADLYAEVWMLARENIMSAEHLVGRAFRLSRAHLRQGRIDEMDRVYVDLVELLNGMDEVTAAQISDAYEQQGDLYLDKEYDRDAGDSRVSYAAGDLYSDAVLLARAAVAYERMVERRRENGPGYDAGRLIEGLTKLSGVYTEQGLNAKAEELEQEIAVVGMELAAELFLEWWNKPDKPTYLGLTVIGWSGILCAAFFAAFVAVIAWLILSRPPPEPLAFGAAAVPIPYQPPAPVRPFPFVGPVFPTEIETAFPPPQIPETRQLAFHADGGSLFAIWIVNTLLTLVTLGTYSFWGKSRIRRYLWAQIELGGDRFAYHGTGLELFVGWLKALPVILVVVYAQVLVPLIWEDKMAPRLVQYKMSLEVIWARSIRNRQTAGCWGSVSP